MPHKYIGNEVYNCFYNGNYRCSYILPITICWQRRKMIENMNKEKIYFLSASDSYQLHVKKYFVWISITCFCVSIGFAFLIEKKRIKVQI